MSQNSSSQNLGSANVTSNGTYTYSFVALSSSTLILFANNGTRPRDFYIDNVLIETFSPGGYSQRLNGSANEKYGIARSLNVARGDVVTAEVWAKYVDTTSAAPDITFRTLLGQISGGLLE